MKLSEEQANAVFHPGNTYVSACPGSGKTRALTARLSFGMSQLSSRFEKVLAVTYTNRAADEIKSRIEQDEHFENRKLWGGTIHSFALEWILRPYAGYLEQINNGFVIADEYETKKILSQLKQDKGMNFYDDVNTSFDRRGIVHNTDENAREVEEQYRTILAERKKIDFDQALYFAYTIVESRPEVATTLGAIFKLICIDEVQDTQDLQYAILSKIYKSSLEKPTLFVVGDINQAIYENLGGISKELEEINQEFEHANLVSFRFSDNYRSTQRVVDYFSYFRETTDIVSKAEYADEIGKITFSNQDIDHENVAEEIASIVQDNINNGVFESDICIIAPQWSPIRALSKKLINLLPAVKFDAPSLSPFYGQQDNFWLTVAKLVLTTPSGRLFSTRVRWGNEIIASLGESFHTTVNLNSKQVLMIINSFKSDTIAGVAYLKESFAYFLSELGLDLNTDKNLAEAHTLFFEKAEKNMERNQNEYEDKIDVFRGFFKESVGVVINTCHGIKGEEYETVIVFGMLKGKVPHWKDIINKPVQVANNAESKMMYVIASRAKKNLYIISESGTRTNTGNPYETSPLLRSYDYIYD